MSERLTQMDEPATLWGVRHAQGIRWCNSETQARKYMADMAARDAHRQRCAQGKVRLVRREIGPVIEVENPYEAHS